MHLPSLQCDVRRLHPALVTGALREAWSDERAACCVVRRTKCCRVRACPRGPCLRACTCCQLKTTYRAQWESTALQQYLLPRGTLTATTRPPRRHLHRPHPAPTWPQRRIERPSDTTRRAVRGGRKGAPPPRPVAAAMAAPARSPATAVWPLPVAPLPPVHRHALCPRCGWCTLCGLSGCARAAAGSYRRDGAVPVHFGRCEPWRRGERRGGGSAWCRGDTRASGIGV